MTCMCTLTRGITHTYPSSYSGWMTIPIVTIVAFTFMGIEGIADEIEMPFGKI